MSKGYGRRPDIKYDSRSSRPGPWPFTVNYGEPCAIVACGLSDGESLSVRRCCGERFIDTDHDLTENGQVEYVALPGAYQIIPNFDQSAERVTVECVCPVIVPEIRCRTELHATGFITVDEHGKCYPVFVERDCASGRCKYIYVNSQGEKTMAFNLFPAQATPPRCERYVTEPVDVTSVEAPAGTTLADIVALALAEDGGSGEYPTFEAVDLATDTVVMVEMRGEKENDVVLIDGNPQGGFRYSIENEDSTTFPGQTPVEVPEGCEMTVSVCIRQCRNKANEIV